MPYFASSLFFSRTTEYLDGAARQRRSHRPGEVTRMAWVFVLPCPQHRQVRLHLHWHRAAQFRSGLHDAQLGTVHTEGSPRPPSRRRGRGFRAGHIIDTAQIPHSALTRSLSPVATGLAGHSAKNRNTGGRGKDEEPRRADDTDTSSSGGRSWQRRGQTVHLGRIRIYLGCAGQYNTNNRFHPGSFPPSVDYSRIVPVRTWGPWCR